MIEVSITEFRNNLRYYSKMIEKEDILVMNNGKPVMQITNPNKQRLDIVKSLIGSVPYADYDEIMEGKLKEL